jgi:hypothetical protein
MPLMRCRPGAGLWTRDSTSYQDGGTGEVMVTDIHVAEAIVAGWTLIAEAPALGERVDRLPTEHPPAHEPPAHEPPASEPERSHDTTAPHAASEPHTTPAHPTERPHTPPRRAG